MSSTTYTPPTPRQPYQDRALDGEADNDPIAGLSEDVAELALAVESDLLDALTLDT